MKKLLYFPLSMMLSLSCGQNYNSDLDGHYESSTEIEMADYEGQQKVVPEYEDSRGVIISLSLLNSYNKEDMAAEILKSDIDVLWVTVPQGYQGTVNSSDFSRLRSLVGRDIGKVRLVEQKTRGSISVWARDWAPLGAIDRSGDLRLVDFNYYTSRPADDVTPQSMGDLLGVSRISVPVYNEGGNFMNNRKGDCLMTTRVTDANRYKEVTGDMVLNNAQISDYYKRFAGCRQVKIFPRIPYEGTGHIDMWAKFMDDDTVIVSELNQDLTSYYSRQADLNKALNVQKYLNDRARDIEAMGFTVVRIPMPVPEFGYYGAVMRSYTNSLTINGRAIIPQYVSKSGWSQYPDQGKLEEYEQEVLQIYRELGYDTAFIESDKLIAAGGAVHCTTMQITR